MDTGILRSVVYPVDSLKRGEEAAALDLLGQDKGSIWSHWARRHSVQSTSSASTWRRSAGTRCATVSHTVA